MKKDGKNAMSSKLFFSPLPKFDTLIGYRATHYPLTGIIGIQPPCCRELVFTVSEILVSPAFDSKSNLLIVTEKTFGTSKEFLEKLNKLRIKLHSKIEVDAELFQFCFTYTLYQKLAPFWNKTAQFLVRGRNFLHDNQKLPAVGLDVIVSNKICLALECFLVKMPPVQLEDFLVNFEALWKFKRNMNYAISSSSLEDSSCYVLPSLKRARIHSITHKIPDGAPFECYEDLRQHWKVTYGYRLPSDECQLYFNVNFTGSTIFTYPQSCIRSCEPIRYGRCNQDEISDWFLKDLVTRMPTICSIPLRFTKDCLYWNGGFADATSGNKSFLVKGQGAHQNVVRSQTNLVSSPRRFPVGRQSGRTRHTNPYHASTLNSQSSTDPPNPKYTSESLQNHLHGRPVSQKTEEELVDFQKQAGNERQTNIVDIPDSPCFDQFVPGQLSLVATLPGNEERCYSDQNYYKMETDYVTDISRSDEPHGESFSACQIVPDAHHEGELTKEEDHSTPSTLLANPSDQNTNVNRGAKENYSVQRTVPEEDETPESRAEYKSTCLPMRTDLDDISSTCHNKDKLRLSDVNRDLHGSVLDTDVKSFSSEHNVIKRNLSPVSTSNAGKTPNKIVPSFGKKSNLRLSSSVAVSSDKKLAVPPSSTRIVPTFGKKKCNNERFGNTSDAARSQGMNTQQHKSEVTAKKAKIFSKTVVTGNSVRTKVQNQRQNNSIKCPLQQAKVETPFSMKSQIDSSQQSTVISSSLSPSRPPKAKRFCPAASATPVLPNQGIELAMKILSQISEIASPVSNVADHTQQPDSTVTKKPRSKTKVQENLDVEQMAKSNQLNKVNAPTLKAWLKSKGIACKSTEKKDELVKKVQVFLNIYQEEVAQEVRNYIASHNSRLTNISADSQ